MDKKKYEITNEKKIVFDKSLFRIRALIDSKFAKKGDFGGWIEKEENLAQDGDAWVYGDAQVSGDAQVYGNARVSGNAQVYGNARVYGKIKINSDLCSRFDFQFQWQVLLWEKKEKEFIEESNKKLKML